MNQTIPHTPFSTSLSGSARETELRLRNIFSGPKKRPPALFLALVFSLCLLCGDLFSLQPARAASEHSPISILRGVVRALLEDRWDFPLTLLDRADKDRGWNWDWDDKDESWEQEQEAAQMAEYQSVGITHDGKNYYYQGQLVNIFLDQRPNKSFYTLDLNPSGTVNVKILRSEDGAITGAAYMTDVEVKELLEDMRSD